MSRIGLSLLSIIVWAACPLWVPSAATAAAARPAQTARDDAQLKELLEILAVPETAAATTRQVVTSLRAANPKVPPEVWDRYGAHMSSREVILGLYGPIYARYLPRDEIEQLIVFYHSPVGNHLRSVLPQIRADYLSAVNQRVRDGLLGSQAALAAEAPVDAHDTATTDSIHALLTESGTIDAARQEMSSTLDRLRSSSVGDLFPASLWDRAVDQLTRRESLLDLWTPAYRRAFSEAEIADLLAFYRSEPGRLFVQALPKIREECLQVATREAGTAARAAVREVMGPLPQWKLTHPRGTQGTGATQGAGATDAAAERQSPGAAAGR
jgi:hypothetical protein